MTPDVVSLPLRTSHFFFQAEDGIRAGTVTGVQTCALPIYGEDIRAVIWFCDLRDSTPIADSMSRAEFLGVLNEFFECILGPVLEHRGEVLRFIGDAALAIFPIPGEGELAERAEASRRAVQAAQ